MQREASTSTSPSSGTTLSDDEYDHQHQLGPPKLSDIEQVYSMFWAKFGSRFGERRKWLNRVRYLFFILPRKRVLAFLGRTRLKKLPWAGRQFGSFLLCFRRILQLDSTMVAKQHSQLNTLD